MVTETIAALQSKYADMVEKAHGYSPMTTGPKSPVSDGEGQLGNYDTLSLETLKQNLT